MILYCNLESKLNLNKDLYDKNSKEKFAWNTFTSCKLVKKLSSHMESMSFFSKYFNFKPKKEEKMT